MPASMKYAVKRRRQMKLRVSRRLVHINGRDLRGFEKILSLQYVWRARAQENVGPCIDKVASLAKVF